MAAPVFVALGILAVVWAVLAFRSQRRYLRKALQATAVVQSVTEERSQRTGTFYIPVVQFKTPAGIEVTATSKSGQGRRYVVGQSISVLYDPDDPQNLEIDAFWSRWLVVMAAIFFALVFFGIGTGVFVFHR
jgi:uncharacterized protein DUF3592